MSKSVIAIKMADKIPKGWRKEKVLSVFNIITGTTPSTKSKQYWENGKINWITPADFIDINTLMKISESKRKISEVALSDTHLTLIPKGSIILSTRAPVGYVGLIIKETAINQGCKGLVPKNGEINSTYIGYYLLSKRRELNNLSGGSTFKELSKEALENFDMIFPPKPEQNKIAEIISTVDDNLEETDRIIKECELIKKGMMQTLLTRGIPNRHKKFKTTEIGEIPEEWKVMTLFEITDEMVQGINTAIDKPDYADEGVPILKANDIIDGNIDLERADKITQESFDSYDKRFKITKGDFLYSNIGARLGSGSLYHGEHPCAYAWNVMRMTPKITIVIPKFLAVLMNSPMMLKEIKRIETGSGMGFVPKKNLEKIKMPLSSIEEQKIICDLIEGIETRLFSEKKMLLVLSNTKKSLMQKLLSGEIRVKVN